MATNHEKKEQQNLSKERDKRVIPIARKILLALAARDDLVMGGPESITTEDAALYYQQKYIDIIAPMLIEEDMYLKDIDYLFQLMSQPLNFVKEITISSFAMNRDIADAQMYGVDDIDDLKVSTLDSKLKEFAKPKE